MSKQTTKEYDAIVVGAGVVGAALALGLSRIVGWNVALVEKNPAIKTAQQSNNLRVVALGAEAHELFERLGTWGLLRQSQCYPFKRMHVWDENSLGELEFKSEEYGLAMLGHIVDQIALQELLQQQIVEQSNIQTYYSTDIEHIDLGALPTLHTQSGCLQAKWLFAADGVHSSLRQLAGIKTSENHYHQQSIVAKVKPASSHQDTAWQRFLSTGPLALLPLYDNNCSIVWSASCKESQQLMELDDKEFANRLLLATQGRLGDFEMLSPRQSFPLASRQAKHYLYQKMVLVGDAAHSIHPLAGQGANLGFGDVLMLLNVIGDCSAEDISLKRIFRKYERQRKLISHVVDSTMTHLNGVYRKNNLLIAGVRKIGMNAINQNNLMKSFFVSQGFGRR